MCQPAQPIFLGREALLMQVQEGAEPAGGGRADRAGDREDPARVSICRGPPHRLYRRLVGQCGFTGGSGRGFVSLAQVLGLPERSAQEQEQAVAAVQRWLNSHRRLAVGAR